MTRDSISISIIILEVNASFSTMFGGDSASKAALN